MSTLGPSALDKSIIQKLIDVKEVIGVSPHEQSDWSDKFRIDTILHDLSKQSYFLKISKSNQGRLAIGGEFESISALHTLSPDFVPCPIGWGTFYSDPDSHFFLCHFHDLRQDLPEPEALCAKLVELHQKGTSPNGKFGFHVITFNGNLLR